MANVMTPAGTVCFDSLFKTNTNRGKELNGVELVYAAGELDAFKKEVKDTVTSELNGKVPANFRWPWRKNETRVKKDTGERYSGYPDGGEFLRVNREASHPKIGPLPLHLIRNEKNEPAAPEEIYSGCKGRCHVYLHCYPSIDGGDPGVKLCLEAFQKTADGERIAGRVETSPDVFNDTSI